MSDKERSKSGKNIREKKKAKSVKKEVQGPIISIITPYYNCQNYIEETAKSVLSQTFPYFEWIIVDDGSSEEGIAKLKQIEKLDKRIKIFYKFCGDNLGTDTKFAKCKNGDGYKICKRAKTEQSSNYPKAKGQKKNRPQIKEPSLNLGTVPKLKNRPQIKEPSPNLGTVPVLTKGPAVARDFGIENSAETAKYIVFLDADDIYDKTYLECCYWTLETHPEASWTYTDSVNFGARNFLWRKWYDVPWEKEENLLIVSSCIRKKDLQEVGGFNVKEKKVYEDWYLWLKLIKAGKYPVRMNSLLTYYRQKEEASELKESNTKNRKNALKLVDSIKGEIYQYKEGVQFPKYDYDWEEIKDENSNIIVPKEDTKNKKKEKFNVLMIIPWMVTGGADRFNLNLVSKMNKEKFDFTIITTLPSKNEWRKYFEKYATIYDLTTFLEMKDWLSFINYIIKKNNINLIFNSNSQFGYKVLPYIKAKYPEIPIVDYVHMEEWYWRSGGYSRDSSMVQDVIDKTFTCNENSRKIFVKHFKRNAKEIKTIYIGVDEKKFDPENIDKRKVIQKLNLQNIENKKVISYICRIADQKRPYLFFEICKKLAKIRNDFVVIVAGDGPFLEGLKNKVKENKLENIFYFVGEIKETEEIYKISDITVNTSIKEGLALTSYESLAMGVPVVSSDVGGQKELITDDVGAVVPCMQQEKDILNFEYTDEEIQGYIDAICKILDNLEMYKNNCRARILKSFTIDKMIKKMEKEFEKVAKSPNEEKVENGKILSQNMDILKELISTYFASSKPDYEWLVQKFNQENVHKIEKYDKKAQKMLYYEHTLEYKIKHPIVVALRKIGVYDQLKKVAIYGINNFD